MTRRMNIWGRAAITMGLTAALAMSGLASASADPGPNAGTIDEVSLTPGGAAGNGNSDFPSISRDGSVVAFTSQASDLVADDNNGHGDVFVLDAATGEITLISRTAHGRAANDQSFDPQVSANGRFVTYTTWASNLPGPPGVNNGGLVYRYDIRTGSNQLVSHTPRGALPLKPAGSGDISSTGRFVVYFTRSHNMVAGDHNNTWDIFRWNARTDTTKLVSKASDGGGANGPSIGASVSKDGSVVYRSKATNIVPLAGNDRGEDIYFWDAATGQTELVSRAFDGGFANGASNTFDVSANGNYIAFDSRATNLVDDDSVGYQAFLYSTATGITTRISTSFDDWPGGAASLDVSISGNGGQVAYTTDRVDTPESGPQAQNVVVYDRDTGVNTWVSTTPNGTVANDKSYLPEISGNGEQIAFASLASNLPRHSDTNQTLDVYIWTRSP